LPLRCELTAPISLLAYPDLSSSRLALSCSIRKTASMQTIKLLMSQKMSRTVLESILQQWSEVRGARVTPQGRLARRYKTEGTSMHWHITGLKTGMGTVEVSYDPETGKLDVSVHDNRRGYWALDASRDLAKALNRRRQQS